MLTYSATLNIRKDRPGLASVYLLLRVGNEKSKLFLDIKVDPLQWDDVRKKLKGKTAEITTVNNQISSEHGRAASIINTYRLRESATGQRGLLTMEQFKKELTGYVDQNNFIAFAFAELERRKPALAYNTYRGHKSRLGKLREFRRNIAFHELTPKLLDDYNTFLVKRGNKIGARETALKTLRAYLKIALSHGHEFKDPFKVFKIRKGATHREALELHELKKLMEYHKSCKWNHKQVLDLFLFQCFTGLRHGDVIKLKSGMLVNDTIRLMPEKTRAKQKIVEIPLSNMARIMIGDRTGQLFTPVSNQKCNKNLKTIASKLGINKDLTTHVARHTFATTFLSLGGSLDVLQRLLGHDEIKTTMIYAHMADGRPKEQMKLFDRLLK